MLADRVEMEVHAGTEWLDMYVRVAVDTQEQCVKQVSYMNAQEYFMQYHICWSCSDTFISIYPYCMAFFLSRNQPVQEDSI